ncbi:hypothetical protein CY34DRAFT_16372 [Suillus luteus UH-Slu-Lm8-n1]|uniref:alanine--tRNA ligase n=1 Tax=Suillus luteus UH-Slu-Lm8-n1 TaxID=930992 RepID=A0A0D0A478_9AGAM|nr:hypothetical protein CY34DRAFT_16372 [Suillus luteus UH-Slu-Lm8-n1]
MWIRNVRPSNAEIPESNVNTSTAVLNSWCWYLFIYTERYPCVVEFNDAVFAGPILNHEVETLSVKSCNNIVIDGATDFEVTNVQSYNGYVLHTGSLKYGQLSVGDEVISSYDELRRWPLRSNHTATHILNFCLREVLGDHIDQRGSLVAPTKLRFDFSHKTQISLPELAKIESMSIDWIKKNVKVYGKDLDLTTVHKIYGLRAVFGEAYPDPVRVVVLGYDVDEVAKDIDNPKWRSMSVEFCGGTHVAKTGDIKDFVITEERNL